MLQQLLLTLVLGEEFCHDIFVFQKIRSEEKWMTHLCGAVAAFEGVGDLDSFVNVLHELRE